MNRHHKLLAAAVAALPLFAATAPALAQPANGGPATAPATAPAGGEQVVDVAQVAAANQAQGAVTLVIAEVTGLVQVRQNPTAKWEKATVGMKLAEGVEIRTGPRSSAVCVIPPTQTIVLQQLTTVSVSDAVRQDGGKLRTRVDMKYGRTDYAVESAGQEHDFRIRTPSTTLAVRGTSGSVYDMAPFAPTAETFTGDASYAYAKRMLSVAAGGKLRAGSNSAAETALLEQVVDPSVAAARTQADAQLIASEQSRGAVLSYDQDIGIDVIRGGRPQTDAELLSSLPGRLNFVIRWTGNADMNMFVSVHPGDPLTTITNEGGFTFNPTTLIFPGFGLETAPSGGQMPFDHRGGHRGGQEFCFWPDVFPSAIFGFSAVHSGGETADVRFNVFLEGERQSMFVADANNNVTRSRGVRRTIPAGGADTVLVLIPPVGQFEQVIPETPDETLDGTAPTGGTAGVTAARPTVARSAANRPHATRANRPAAPTRVAAAGREARRGNGGDGSIARVAREARKAHHGGGRGVTAVAFSKAGLGVQGVQGRVGKR